MNASVADLDRQPSPPVRNGSGNGAGPRRCLVCERPAKGRSAYCSDAHRVQAHRLRHHQQLAFRPDALQAELRRRRQLTAFTVYACDDRGERYLGEQRCDHCNRFCRVAGLGGRRPGCDEPVLLTELLGGLGGAAVNARRFDDCGALASSDTPSLHPPPEPNLRCSVLHLYCLNWVDKFREPDPARRLRPVSSTREAPTPLRPQVSLPGGRDNHRLLLARLWLADGAA